MSEQNVRLNDTGWPLIELGFGLIEVAKGKCGNTARPALIFGRNGKGKIGEPTQPDRVHLPGETLAVISFANVEALDVVADTLAQIRSEMLAAQPESLWCVHVHGPDDLIAAPSKEAAEERAHALNKLSAAGPLKDLLSFRAEPWPHTKESHAQSLKRDWPGLLTSGSAQAGTEAQAG